MAVSGDVTFAQDGGPGSVKVHPYLVALVRWCMSSLWSSATVLLHRLMVTSLPPIAAPKASKPRPAGSEHLHPEPRVECVLLHQPPVHTLDVIFVHGLYGSLGNTWRQGEWRSKYNVEPDKVLLRPTSMQHPCKCHTRTIDPDHSNNDTICSYNDENINNNKENRNNKKENRNNNKKNINNSDSFKTIDNKLFDNIRKILPKDDMFITEKFYNNTLLNQVEIIDNYENQAKFVSDLFKLNCDTDCDSKNKNNNEENRFKNENNIKCSCDEQKQSEVDCKCRLNEKQCEVGCGCICDDCYSHCWPKDWIKVDYPGARVISINYTSDPHLWRPLWVKENKRLRLHERAEQMMEQLLELGVGQRPVIWVGHSKGGLFIKQIYCEAYEAHLKIKNMQREEQKEEQNMTEFNIDNEMNNLMDNNNITANSNKNIGNINNNTESWNKNAENGNNNAENRNNNVENMNNNAESRNNGAENIQSDSGGIFLKEKDTKCKDVESNRSGDSQNKIISSECIGDLKKRAGLWSNSAGFMFYSVPHRGSPLADIKTPITARSVELLEISKDCALVLSLQERWLRATATSQPQVRSLVETRRTLMSVLWLRIVSPDSADPGIGALCGVSVDHREICKPTSRRCLLYTELANLIRVALNKCTCQ